LKQYLTDVQLAWRRPTPAPQFNPPVLDCYLGISAARYASLKNNGKTIPDPIPIKALLSTGNNYSLVDPGIVARLDLEPSGETKVNLSIYIGSWSSGDVELIQTPIWESGADLILGRDLLQFFEFRYCPREGKFSLTL
jgi:hypothetical protein